eukprot:GGOE01008408.1.p1 GENE.GGOE01008408.1~~GGOE01008408.1.p1  ORF type:complete len:214 (-),score=56.04 GGOE01008408.1:210-851(-)
MDGRPIHVPLPVLFLCASAAVVCLLQFPQGVAALSSHPPRLQLLTQHTATVSHLLPSHVEVPADDIMRRLGDPGGVNFPPLHADAATTLFPLALPPRASAVRVAAVAFAAGVALWLAIHLRTRFWGATPDGRVFFMHMATTAGEGPKQMGTVKWFNPMKGYGFLITDQDGRDVFVHYKDLNLQGYKVLEEGQRVAFNLTPTERGLQATSVDKV